MSLDQQTDPRVGSSEAPLTPAPTEVVELLGEEAISRIERGVAQVAEIAEIVGASNPFTEERPSDFNPSILNTNQSHLLDSWASTLGQEEKPPHLIRELNTLRPQRKALFKVIRTRINSDWLDAWSGYRALKKAEPEVADFVEAVRTETAEDFLPALKNHLLELAAKATKIPAVATLGRIAGALEIERYFLKQDRKRIRNSAASGVSGSFASRARNPFEITDDYAGFLTRGGRKRYKKAADIFLRTDARTEDAVEIGTRLHQQLVNVAKGWAAPAANTVLDLIRETKKTNEDSFAEAMDAFAADGLQDISASPEAQARLDAAFAVEEFLINRARLLTENMQSMGFEAPNDEVFHWTLQPNLKEGHGRLVQEKLLEDVHKLERDILEMRDILKGGRRIESEEPLSKPIAQVADELHTLMQDEGKRIRLFEPEEQGLVIAMLTGNFEPFVSNVQALKDNPPTVEERDAQNSVLALLESERPELLRQLRRFDIEQAVAAIRRAVRNPDLRNKLGKVLAVGEIASVAEQIRWFEEYQRQRIEETTANQQSS